MHNDQKDNFKRTFGLLKRGAGGVTLSLGTSSLILAVTTAIALVAIATTAWLASNREVDSGSMADINTESFEVGVTETVDVEGNAIAALATRDPAYPENMVYANSLWSSETNAGVICGLKINSNNQNLLSPGATGTLEFLIRPAGGDSAYSTQLSIAALLKMLDESGKVMQDSANNDRYVFRRPGEETGDRARAMALLKGHILFFGDSNYSTSKQIIPETTTLLICPPSGQTTFNSTNTYKVTLYWEWPKTYADLLALIGTIPQEEVSIYFENGTGNIGYDNGDQMIGNHISYVAAEFLLQPSEVLTGTGILPVETTVVS